MMLQPVKGDHYLIVRYKIVLCMQYTLSKIQKTLYIYQFNREQRESYV